MRIGTVAYFNQYSLGGGFKWDGPHQISNRAAGANHDYASFMDVDGYVDIPTLQRNISRGDINVELTI